MSHIAIEHNEKYCRVHDLIKQDVYPCCCNVKDAANPNCDICSGEGSVEYEVMPYAMDLATPNFSTIWHALGIAEVEDKWIDGRTLAKRIAETPVELLVRAGQVKIADSQIGHTTYNDPGIDLKRAEFYLSELKKIADEAAKRESLVVWS